MEINHFWYVATFCFLIEVTSCVYTNTPPTILVDRNWNILNTLSVGSKIVKVHGSSGDGRPLLYGLEGIPTFGHTQINLPFRIDENTGDVYLNRSVENETQSNMRLYVTVSDGNYAAKSEVLVTIVNSSSAYSNLNFGNWHKPFMINHGSGLGSPSGHNDSNLPPHLWNFFQNSNLPKVKDGPTLPKTRLSSISSTYQTASSIGHNSTIATSNDSNLHHNSSDKDMQHGQQLSNNYLFTQTYSIAIYVVSAFSICALLLVIAVVAASIRTRFQNTKFLKKKNDMSIVKKSSFSSKYDHWEVARHKLKFFSLLGEGAFGQVWKCDAIDIFEGQKGVSVVAVKTLKKTASDKEKADFLSEIKIMKLLDQHPHIVSLIGCCTKEDPIFLIMEYVSMGTLQNFLRSSRLEKCGSDFPSKSLTSRDLTSFVYQIAKGMDFLSVNGVIHRDLAARNILLTENLTCKIADFGFARDVSTSFTYERKSDGKLPIRWMAPESLYDNVFTTKSDVWSFGVLMWEVVTLGSTPYPGLSASEVMKKVKSGHRLDKPEHCKRELHNIMYYCWETDPKDRPTFEECASMLEHLLLTETSYIELERFPDHSYYNLTNLSNEKL